MGIHGALLISIGLYEVPLQANKEVIGMAIVLSRELLAQLEGR
jgi:hypothetical protein